MSPHGCHARLSQLGVWQIGLYQRASSAETCRLLVVPKGKCRWYNHVDVMVPHSIRSKEVSSEGVGVFTMLKVYRAIFSYKIGRTQANSGGIGQRFVCVPNFTNCANMRLPASDHVGASDHVSLRNEASHLYLRREMRREWSICRQLDIDHTLSEDGYCCSALHKFVKIERFRILTRDPVPGPNSVRLVSAAFAMRESSTHLE